MNCTSAAYFLSFASEITERMHVVRSVNSFANVLTAFRSFSLLLGILAVVNINWNSTAINAQTVE